MGPSAVAPKPLDSLHLSDLPGSPPPLGLGSLPVPRPYLGCAFICREALATRIPSPLCPHMTYPLHPPSLSSTGTSLLSHLDSKSTAGGEKDKRGEEEGRRREKKTSPYTHQQCPGDGYRWSQVGPGAWARPSRGLSGSNSRAALSHWVAILGK